ESGVVAQMMFEGSAESRRYMTADGIGSTTLVTDDNGQAVERSYYDPFGHRTDDQGVAIDDQDPDTTIGFGAHEEDADGLVNMGGRIYDRNQYRFLTPDPIIQSPLFGQNHNPYSYVLNNPVTFTDPSGFITTDDDLGLKADKQRDPEPPPDPKPPAKD